MNFFLTSVGEIKDAPEISTSQRLQASKDASRAEREEIRSVNIVNVLLNFEIKEVGDFHVFVER